MFTFWILIVVIIILMFSWKFTGNRFKSEADIRETTMDILKKDML